MTILTRYTIALYLRILALCVGSFVSIYIVIDFLEKVGKYTKTGGTVYTIGLLYLWKIPDILSQSMPLAVLMTTLMTLGGLSRTSELTAMRSCGVSILRITSPLLTAAAIISVLGVIAGEVLIPYANERTRYIEDILIKKKSPTAFFRQFNIWFREDDTILQARSFNPGKATLSGVTVWKITPDLTPVERIEARQAVMQDDGWLLKDAVVRVFSQGTITKTSTSPQVPVAVPLHLDDLKVLEKVADNMGFFELQDYTRKLQAGGYDTTRYVAQMHSRISLPFASLVMGLLGIPFALRGGRTSGIAVGIGISLGIGFSYLIVNAVLLSFGQSGVLPGVVSAWAANLMFAAAGMWLTMTMNR